MVPDIPVDHWMCSFWQTQDCSAGNNGFWMHGTVGNNGCTGRCRWEKRTESVFAGIQAAPSGEAWSSGLKEPQPARPTTQQTAQTPSSLILSPAKSLTLSHAQWLTVGIGVNRRKHSSSVFNILSSHPATNLFQKRSPYALVETKNYLGSSCQERQAAEDGGRV